MSKIYGDNFPERGGSLVDIGAHEGLYAIRASRYFPGLLRTILVEPLPKYAANLRKLNIPSAEVVEVALADHQGEALFSINHTEQASSLLEINPEMNLAYALNLDVIEKVPVKLSTLDQLAYDMNFGQIDLVKIDVQGAERELLAGATKTLESTKYIEIELLFVEQYRECAQFFELNEIMMDAGFCLGMLIDFAHSPTGQLLQADGVYLNKRYFGDKRSELLCANGLRY